MKKYQYIDPVDEGFTKLHLTRQHHNSAFKNDPVSIFWRSDYYIRDDKLIIHRTTSLFWIIIVTIGFPLVALGYGIFNFKGVLKEYYVLYNEKRLGHFTSRKYRKTTETYQIVAFIAKNTGQWC